ncbi:hypothetical protein Cgig2_030715 [Carnegiea gigantea]|uniref:Uncharacterized protein n=1 Tax=Carnegiea gigantea TaxID=171969 RepID=A0A9Q1K6J2_9CARY|nr:hypothetical protein Cgig2_030715 [Carnegiea gigantea]
MDNKLDNISKLEKNAMQTLRMCSFLGAHEQTMAESCEPVLSGWCTRLVPALPLAVLRSSPLELQELPKTLPISCPHSEMQGSRQHLDRFLYMVVSYLTKESRAPNNIACCYECRKVSPFHSQNNARSSVVVSFLASENKYPSPDHRPKPEPDEAPPAKAALHVVLALLPNLTEFICII